MGDLGLADPGVDLAGLDAADFLDDDFVTLAAGDCESSFLGWASLLVGSLDTTTALGLPHTQFDS